MPTLLAIAAGGALGALARWMATAALPDGRIPWAVLLVNVIGSALLGLVLVEEWSDPRARLVLRDFAGIGFCGGMTTFSTFAVDVVNLVDAGRATAAAAYVAATLLGGFGALILSTRLMRRRRAVTLPLEEEP